MITSGDFDDLSAWDCTSCSINALADGYNGQGVTIDHRNQAYKSVKQEVPCTQFAAIAGQDVLTSAYMRFPGPHGQFDVQPTMRIWGDNFDPMFLALGTTTIPAVDGPDDQWYSVSGTQTFDVNGGDLTGLTCRFYMAVKDKETAFDIDRVLMVPVSSVEASLKSDLNGNIVNSGFEIPSSSSLFSLTGWITSGSNTLETVTAADAPEGTSYLKVGNRVNPGSFEVGQVLTLPENFDADQLIEIQYWAKFSYADAAEDAATLGEDRHNEWLGKMQLIHEPNSDGVEVTTQHQCHKACMIPDGKWRQYHATCNMAKAVQGRFQFYFLACLGKITKTRTFHRRC